MLNWDEEIKPSAQRPVTRGSSGEGVVKSPPSGLVVHTFVNGFAKPTQAVTNGFVPVSSHRINDVPVTWRPVARLSLKIKSRFAKIAASPNVVSNGFAPEFMVLG
jgi:hypothetical protein